MLTPYTIAQFKQLVKNAQAIKVAVSITPDAETLLTLTKQQAHALAAGNHTLHFFFTRDNRPASHSGGSYEIIIDGGGENVTGTSYSGKARKSGKPFCE